MKVSRFELHVQLGPYPAQPIVISRNIPEHIQEAVQLAFMQVPPELLAPIFLSRYVKITHSEYHILEKKLDEWERNK